MSETQLTKIYKTQGEKIKERSKNKNDKDKEDDPIVELNINNESDNLLTNILNDYYEAVWRCDDLFNDAGCMDFLSLYFQDVATLSSSTAATVTFFLTAGGCIAGLETAVLPGCAAGYGVGASLHFGFFNVIETGASFTSFGATMWSDMITQDTKFDTWNPNDWRIGEDTRTGFFTLLAGTLLIEPFFDAGVDIYASGYNHGYFCGISTILDCVP